MKQLLSLFLFLLPCLAWAQYPSNGNQKITLGEQTTADGLIWRGIASDTTLTAKSDTAAYFVLDTANLNLYTYKVSATGRKWIQVETDSASIAYVNTYGTQTVNGAKTFTTAPTFSTALLGGSGGSGITSFGAANRIPYAASTTALTTASNLTFINSGNRTLQVSASNNNEVALFKALNAASQSFEVGVWGSTTGAFGAIANSNAYTYGATDFATVVANDAGTVKWGIGTGGAERMRLEGIDGELKIGYGATDNGAYKLQVNGNGFFKGSTNVGPQSALNITNSSDASLLFVRNDGNVGIGTTSPTEKLHVVGNARITAVGAGTFSNNLNITSDGTLTTATSDIKFKYNIRPLNYGLETLLQLKPVNFQWIEGQEEDLGFIAQDVAEIIPEAVNTNWNSDLLFRYESLIPILTKAIQEQNLLIKALEQRIINLENK